MATRALQQVITYLAWNTSTNVYVTGDSANHSLSWCKDGTRSAATNAAAEVDSTNMPGLYKCTMTSTETDCIEGTLGGKSSTSNVILIPTMVAFDYLNTSAPTTAGIPDVNAKNIGGTAQTGRDIGASVLLSSGTATGQIKIASGYVAMTWADIAAPTTAQNLSGTQISSVNNLAAGTDSINTVATSGSTITTGSVTTGTFASTAQLDGSYWQIADSAGTLDMYLQFNVGTSGVPTAGQVVAGLTSALNSLKVYAFNWAGSSWDQIGNLAGTSSIIVSTLDLNFTTAHVGTGGNIGLVRVRFANTGLTSANLYLDYAICGYTQPLTVGQIATGVWTDTTSGDFTVSASVGKSIMNGVSLGTGLTVAAVSGTVGSVTGSVGSISGITFPTNFSTLGISAAGKINEVVLTDTLTTYTGNTVQTGDSYGRLGAPAGASVSADVAAIKSDTGTILGQTGTTGVVVVAADRPGIRKNVALGKFEFLMTDSTNHNPATGLTVTVTRSIDNGSFGSGTLSAVTEIANGIYSVDFGAGDLNGGVITLQATATAADSLFVTIVTTP